jgi:hypothetical protein
MPLTLPGYSVENIQGLTDLTKDQATAVKVLFDKTGADTKTFLLETMIPELNILDAANVKLSGDQTIAGVKTFSSSPIVPTPTTDMQTSTKKYPDDIMATHQASADHDGRYFTETEIQATTDGASGADKIGVTAIPTLAGGTVQAVLESAKARFDDIDTVNVNAEVAGTHTGADGGVYATLPIRLDAMDTEFDAYQADNATQLALKANQTDLVLTNNVVSLKANTADVNTQIASVTSGSPKGTYATVALLTTAFPAGNTNIYVVTADGKWYYWSGSAWTVGGIYQAGEIDAVLAQVVSNGYNIDRHNLLLISECERFDKWKNNNYKNNVGGTVSGDLAHFETGGQGIAITTALKLGGGHLVKTMDLSKFPDGSPSTTVDYIRLWLYIEQTEIDKMESTGAIFVRFLCEVEGDANIYYYTSINKTTLIAGPQIIKIRKSRFTAVSTASWANVKGLDITYTGTTAPTASMTFTVDAISMERENKATVYPTGSVMGNPDFITISAPNTIKVARFRYGYEDGTFKDCPTTTIGLAGAYDYIIADCTGATIALTKGIKTYWWQEINLPRDKFVFLYKNAGYYGSQLTVVQGVLNTLFPYIENPSVTIVTVGAGQTYTDIKSALDSITDNSFTNRYQILVLNGEYDLSLDGLVGLGMKNYVDIVGQSRNGVRVIKRLSGQTGNSVFNASQYDVHLDYASLRNMTLISYKCKAPVHIDSVDFNLIELINLNLINENTPDLANYQNCLAIGLTQNEHVVCKGVYANGVLWAHNKNNPHYEGKKGCSFELYNCISKSIQIGDLLNYGHDTFIAEGCKAEYLNYLYYKNYGTPLSYVTPSFDCQLKGNTIDYIKATTTTDGGVTTVETGWDELNGGKVFISEPSIYSYCKNVSVSNLAKGSLVTLDESTDMNGIKAWVSGGKLFGQALEVINASDFGIVQNKGILFMSADGTTPISMNDAIELNSSGVVIKHNTGDIIGYARQALGSGTGTIKVKLVS